MPIKPEFRYLYCTADWKKKRAEALERADHKCNRCKVPNETIVERRMVRTVAQGCRAWWRLIKGTSTSTKSHDQWFDEKGRASKPPAEYTRQWTLFVSLGVAHRDHNPENMDDENLEVLCCRCHIMHDRTEHTTAARRTRQTRKDATRPLTALLSPEAIIPCN